MKLRVNDTVIIKKSCLPNSGKKSTVKEIISDYTVTLNIDDGMFCYGYSNLIKVDIVYYMPVILKFLSYILIATLCSYFYAVILPIKDKFFAGVIYTATVYSFINLINTYKIFKLKE